MNFVYIIYIVLAVKPDFICEKEQLPNTALYIGVSGYKLDYLSLRLNRRVFTYLSLSTNSTEIGNYFGNWYNFQCG